MRLKEFLIQNNIRQERIAELIGIRPGLVSKHARGLVMPSPERCEDYKNATNGAVTANDFHEHYMEVRGRNGK